MTFVKNRSLNLQPQTWFNRGHCSPRLLSLLRRATWGWALAQRRTDSRAGGAAAPRQPPTSRFSGVSDPQRAARDQRKGRAVVAASNLIVDGGYARAGTQTPGDKNFSFLVESFSITHFLYVHRGFTKFDT